ncbi:Rho1 guanine nucleotide exchange factor 3 [Pleurostoma richardsiae]|uniref:Rho1 guanine nucleotide exchange factor 3 n=1 Tax=Pleurostoma richardsiae TaxID=41990 RepID=A0AA38VYZ2_9PEZI|nr:Rho1 guanine nucleotide exchange factor 3 [Pleurostoma richardsiae]
MSFRGDSQRRYGHVPPVQYPVADQDQNQYLPRRPSFNNGDDAAFLNEQRPAAPGHGDELFLANPAGSQTAGYSTANPTASVTASNYQQPLQAQSPASPTYNPQQFARSQSTTLPYHSHARYPAPPTTSYTPQPTNYTPAAYDPSAYAGVAAPQRQATYHGFNNYAHSYSAPAVPQTSTSYGQLANSTYSPSQPQPSQSPQMTVSPSQPSYGQSFPTSPYSSMPGTMSSQAGFDSSSQQYPSGYFASYQSNGSSPAAPTGYPTTAPTTTSASQAPYPTYSQIPVGPNYSASDPNSFLNRTSRSNAQTSPVPSPPARPQPSPGLHRHPTNAPLPSRPMDDVPEESDWDPSARDDEISQEYVSQDSLIEDIVGNLGVSANPRRPRPINGHELSDDEWDRLRRYDSTSSTVPVQGDDAGLNRYPSSATASTLARNDVPSTFGYDDDESDQEGAAGVLLMQQDEMNDLRFSSGPTFPYVERTTVPPPSLPTPAEEQQSSDGDFAGVDIGMFSGGYAGNLTYGNDVGSPPATASTQQEEGRPLPTPRSGTYDEPPYPNYDADMDYGGTGGLQIPAPHRLSFDEGDERVSVNSRGSGSESPYKDDIPDMFYHPGLSSRPLPALPPGSDTSSMLSVQTPNGAPYQQHSYSLSADSRPYRGEALEAYYSQLTAAQQQQQQVERSISLSSHSNTPQIQVPGRSRTDAAEERKKALKQMTQQQQLAAQQGVQYDGYDTGTPSSVAYDVITLPTGRKRKFIPSKLTVGDFRRCTEPWALSGLASWIREMAEGETDLKRKNIEEGFVKLFSGKVPTMNIADAETLSAMVVDSMFEAGILIPEEEWVKFGQGSISGVLWQLTGAGCYAPKLHENEIPGRCYSHHCTRTLKKANLDELMSEDSVKKEDWVTYYKVTEAMIEGKGKKEIERQNILHEIVTGEEDYMNQLDVIRLLYRDQLRAWQPPIIPPNRLKGFMDSVFRHVDTVQKVNREYLLAQLKYRQGEQGPFIIGFSDIFREWIRKAKTAYVDYSQSYPIASYTIRKEADRNILFRQFLDHVRNHKRSERLGWDTFMKAPITRLQRYSLLLNTVLKQTIQESEEKTNLIKAIEEIKAVTLECDKAVDDAKKKADLMELERILIMRPGFQSVLNLDHLGRELILQGELQRMGSKGVRWVDTHALLFDHYLILAKAVSSKDGRGDKKYDVSKEPIPMPLLFLESMNDDPVSKQKGITAPLARTTIAGSDTKLNKMNSNGVDRPGLEQTPTSSSMGSMNTTIARLTPSSTSDSEGKILYPFKVKHLGHEVYTLYATTPQSRQDWCNKIIDAKTRHARALHNQNAEPFRLRVLADGAFAYDSSSPMGRMAGVSIRGTPLDRAIREMEQVYGPGRGPPPVCRAQVNCATAFSAYSKSIIAIGTDFGIYISEASNPRGWTRSVQINRVTQIAVLEEFSICLVIADRSLISYPLDVIAPVSNFPAPAHDNPRRAPQRLSKDVSFFATARMKERMLLFYKRKEGMHNTFKVLEPVFQKATEKKPRIFGGRRGGAGSTETFRDFDEFYLPTECYSLNLFQTYIAVATAKGIEMLTLDKKQTMSVPSGLNLPAIANIASRIRDQRPLGMFRLNDQEFLLTYEDCAVYVDKHGEVSRTLIMEYSGKQKKARGATMFGQYLILFNEDYVEVRNAENGRLRQIIAGRDVRCLDHGFRGPTGSSSPQNLYGAQPGGLGQDSKGTVKIGMAHPEVPGLQIVLEMLLNDGHSEKA